MLRSIRRAERRDAFGAFFLLFAIIAAHSVLEAARDALFLAKLPASQLPWVYLAIAAVSLGIVQVQRRRSTTTRSPRGPRGQLSASLAGAAAVTALLWIVREPFGDAGLYAVYVWSGVMATLVLVQFWLLLGDLFTITQAKRLYGFIGAGSVLGAITGSALAAGLTSITGAEHLLLAAALVLLGAAAAPWLLSPVRGGAALPTANPEIGTGLETSAAAETTTPKGGLLADLRFVAERPYARRIAALVAIGTAALTLADFLFKDAVAAAIPADELGAWLATFYLIVNVASLATQLLAVAWVVKTAGVVGALTILPLLIAAGGLGLIFAPALYAAIAIKGADGAMRYSIHRTASELVFVPMAEETRRRVKSLIDVVIQRGGQGVASLLVLAATALAIDTEWIAALLVVFAGTWFMCAFSLSQPYLELFRAVLKGGRRASVERFPELDLASFETLVAALDSDDDEAVLAALDVLEAEGRQRVVPALILYHPAESVVDRALGLVSQGGRRRSVMRGLDHLIEHASPKIRAAAIATRSVVEPDERFLRMRLSLDESPEVRATIMVNLIAAGEIVGEAATYALESVLKHGSLLARVALAQAIGRRPNAKLDDILVRLAKSPDLEVRLAVIDAVKRLRRGPLLPLIVGLLAEESTRRDAMVALVESGGDAIHALEAALLDPTTPQMVRWQVPRTLARFEPNAVAGILLARLPEETDGMVRHRIIRGLRRLTRREPLLQLDPEALDSAVARELSRAFRYLDRRIVLERGAEAAERLRTPGHGLLVRVLRDKGEHTVERLFRLLGLKYPSEDFGAMLRGLGSDDGKRSSSALELLENILDAPLRDSVVALVAPELSPPERLAGAGAFHTPFEGGYREIMASLLNSSSVTILGTTVFHAGELRMTELSERIDALPPNPSLDPDVALALMRFEATDVLEEVPA